MSQHTPGPWIIVEREAGRDLDETFVGPSDEGIVAGCWPYGRLGTQEANARLIAAAPELLAAGKRLCRPSLMVLETDIAEMKRAIAKAEGRTE